MAEKRGKGRPKFKLDANQISQLEKMAGLGMPMDQMAALLDMAKDTLERMYKRDKRIKAALSRGRAKASGKIRETAYNQAVGGNTTMLIFWLKVRERWKEPVVDESNEAGDSEGITLNYSLEDK